MIEIKFQGNSMENLIRQITAFAENVAVKENRKGKHEQPKPVFFTEEEKQRMTVGYKNRSL